MSFAWLMEAGLKPLIKGVLNRVLAPYMLQKLELAQIGCRLTDGGGAQIGIHDLELDPEGLDVAFDALPVDIVAGTVGKLDVRIPLSVQGVLDDGASLEAANVRLQLRLSDLADDEPPLDVSILLQEAASAGEGSELALASSERRPLDESVSSMNSDSVLEDFDEQIDAQSAPEGMTLVEVALKRVFANIEGTFANVEVCLDCGAGRSVVIRVDRLTVKDTTSDLCAPDAESEFDQATAAERTRQIRFRGFRVSCVGFYSTTEPTTALEYGLLDSASETDSLVSLVSREHPQSGVPALSVDVSLQDVAAGLQPKDFGILMEVIDRCTNESGADLPADLFEMTLQATSLDAAMFLDNLSVEQRKHVGIGHTDTADADHIRVLLDHPQLVFTGACESQPTAKVVFEASGFQVQELGWVEDEMQEEILAEFDPRGPDEVVVAPRLRARFGGVSVPTDEAECALTATVLLRSGSDTRVRIRTGNAAISVDPLIAERFEHYIAAAQASSGQGKVTAETRTSTSIEVHIPAARLKLRVPAVKDGEMSLPDSGRGRSVIRATQQLGFWIDATDCIVGLGMPNPLYDETVCISFADALVYLASDEVTPFARLSCRSGSPDRPTVRCAVRAVASLLSREPTPLPSAFGRRFSMFEGSNPAVHPASASEAQAYEIAGQPDSNFDIRITTPSIDATMTTEQYQQLMRLIDDLVLGVTVVSADAPEAVVVDSDSDDDDFERPATTIIAGSTSSMHDLALAFKADSARVTIDFGGEGHDESKASYLDLRGEGLEIRTLAGLHGTLDQTILVHTRTLSVVEKLPSDESPVSLLDPTPYSAGGDYSTANPKRQTHMLSVSVTMELNSSRTHSRMAVAVGVANLRLHHRMLAMGSNWIFRVLGWMKYPKLNRPEDYRYPEELLQLHVHFWDMSIIYRPLQLAATTEILCYHLLITSNMASDLNNPDLPTDLVMSFLAEDLAMYLKCEEGEVDTERAAPTNHPISRSMKNVICDKRLDLQLRESGGKFEVSLEGNDCFTVCTRCDSLCTLSEVLDYYFDGKDLVVVETSGPGGAPLAPDIDESAEEEDDDDSFHSAFGDENHDLDIDVQDTLGADIHEAPEPLAETLAALSMEWTVPTDDKVGTPELQGEEELSGEDLSPDPDLSCDQDETTLDAAAAAAAADADAVAEAAAQEQEAQVRSALAEAMGGAMASADETSAGEAVPSDPDNTLDFDWNHFGRSATAGDPQFAHAATMHLQADNVIADRGSDSVVVPIAFPVHVEANHFVPKLHRGRAATLIESRFPSAVFSLRLKDVAVSVQLFRGYDWLGSDEETQQDRFDGDEKEAVILEISGLTVEYDEYGEDDRYAMRMSVVAHQIEVLDRLVRTTRINKLLTDFKSQSHPRDTSTDMLSLDWVTARNVEMKTGSNEEIIMRIALLPLRLNLDQLAVVFLGHFYEYVAKYFDDVESTPPPGDSPTPTPNDPQKAAFVKLCHIDPVFVQVDYEPRVTNYYNLIRKGDLSELVGIVPLRHAYVSLSEVTTRGTTGWDKLGQAVCDEWMTDCVRIHGPTVLAGVAGIRPLTQVAKATMEIVKGPVNQYPHVIQGLAGGFESGARTTAVELCNIAAAVAEGVRVALEVADSAVSVEPARDSMERYSYQPADMAEGFMGARDALYVAGREAFERLYVAPHRGRSHRFVRASILAKTIGAAPGAALRPLIGFCEAVEISVQGVRNSLHPESREDSMDKYR